MKNLLVATVLLAGLSGCALLRSQIAVLHQLPKNAALATTWFKFYRRWSSAV
jgi:uncharacterized protein YceK